MRTLLFVALISLAPKTASATVMVEVPIEDMARDAAAIVVGRVARTEVQVVIDRTGGATPYTLTHIEVSEWIVGSGESTVVLRELGGDVQGRGLSVGGTPTYRAGEEVIVFLERVDGRLCTYGMAQGRFEIRRGVAGVPDHVVRDLAGVSFVRFGPRGMSIGHGDDVPASLETFLDYVRRIATGYGNLPAGQPPGRLRE